MYPSAFILLPPEDDFDEEMQSSPEDKGREDSVHGQSIDKQDGRWKCSAFWAERILGDQIGFALSEIGDRLECYRMAGRLTGGRLVRE